MEGNVGVFCGALWKPDALWCRSHVRPSFPSISFIPHRSFRGLVVRSSSDSLKISNLPTSRRALYSRWESSEHHPSLTNALKSILTLSVNWYWHIILHLRPFKPFHSFYIYRAFRPSLRAVIATSLSLARCAFVSLPFELPNLGRSELFWFSIRSLHAA